ncbi:MAG TPA: hypothetical protein VFK06_12225 [Candidatus Angelobacter sp.]|nr:hypothetical protein [Candidatus Angelobacter sp.]
MKHNFAAFGLLVLAGSMASQQQRTITQPSGSMCPPIVLKGKLADLLQISDCRAISGMTCRISFTENAVLPSRVFLQEIDEANHQAGHKRPLIYSDLKPGESGWATFRVGRARTVVLTGEWKGSWKSAY